MTNFILHAYGFHDNAPAERQGEDDIIQTLKDEALAWVHLDAAHDEARNWLAQNVSYLDNLILDALLAEETRPRVMQHEDGMLVILRGVNLHEGMEPEDMISIRLWIDRHRIISLQRRPLKAIDDICDLLDKGKGPKTAADFLTALSTRLFQRMEPVLSELDERTDIVEEAILETPDAKCRHEIIDIRKKAIILRRYIAPQKDVISYIRSSDLEWVTLTHRRALQESQDRVTRYVEDLDAIRERAQIVKDELASALADQMSKNMYVLSIVAAIFLPLGFFTGLLGINVGGMPGAEYDMAFWFVCLLCTLFAFGIAGLFKALKWI